MKRTVTVTLATLVAGVSGYRTKTGDAYIHPGVYDPTSAHPPPVAVSTGDVPTWEWHSVDGAVCMGQETTGFWIREGNDPTKLAVFLMGGGACFNPLCAQLATSNPKGFNEGPPSTGILRPNVEGSEFDNPLGNHTVIFVPYCTGDVFFGDQDTPTDFGFLAPAKRVFKGRNHVTKVMDSISGHPYINKDLTSFILTGESAGGFGSLANWDFLRQNYIGNPGASSTYFHVPVGKAMLFDDSGIVMNQYHLTPCLTKYWTRLFNLGTTVPQSCTDCQTSLYAIYPYLQATYPDDIFAFISTEEDETITLFYAYGFTNEKNGECGNTLLPGSAPTSFREGVRDFFVDYVIGEGIDTNNFASYFFPGTVHTHSSSDSFFFTKSVFNDLDGGKEVKLVDWYRNVLDGYAQDVENNLFDVASIRKFNSTN